MGRRFLGAMLLGLMLSGQAAALAGPWLRHEHQRCTCHQPVCICHYKRRTPAKPATPSCHGHASTAAGHEPDLSLQNCDDSEEKDLTSASVFLMPEPASLTEPMPGALLPSPGATALLSRSLQISPPPPRILPV